MPAPLQPPMMYSILFISICKSSSFFQCDKMFFYRGFPNAFYSAYYVCCYAENISRIIRTIFFSKKKSVSIHALFCSFVQ
jgi:hypothetical protein